MDPNKYIKYSFYQMSDQVKAGGLFSEAQCKALAQKLIHLYDENKDGQLDLMDVGQMMGDCYRAMNKNYNPTPTDIAAYTRKMDTTGRGRIDASAIESLCLKYLSSGVTEDTSTKLQELPKVEKKIEVKPVQQEEQPIILESGNNQNNLKLSNPDVVVEKVTPQKAPESRQQQILVQTRFLQRHSSSKYSNSPALKEVPQVSSPVVLSQELPKPEPPKPEPPKKEIRPIESYSKVVQERLKVARRIFTFIDEDKGGFITDQEVPQLLIETYKAMGMTIEPTQEDVELWMEMADLDRDGKVYLSDYEDLILRSLKQQGIKLE